MTIKFYGAITGSNGGVNTGNAHSNNFLVSRESAGVYTITLNEWVAKQPIVIATPISNSFNLGTVQEVALVSGLQQISDDNSAWQVTVKTYSGGVLTDIDFSFTAVCGSNLVVSTANATSIVLQPEVATFGLDSRQILKIAFEVTDGQGTPTSYYVDAATVLDVVSTEDVTVNMGTLSGYDLMAYVYQAGSSEPTEWNTSSTISPPTDAMVTDTHRIVVTATPTSGTGTTLWSDPVVRLSKEAPDGITTETA